MEALHQVRNTITGKVDACADVFPRCNLTSRSQIAIQISVMLTHAQTFFRGVSYNSVSVSTLWQSAVCTPGWRHST